MSPNICQVCIRALHLSLGSMAPLAGAAWILGSSQVKPEDDGVWGDFWSKNSEKSGRGCDYDVGCSAPSSAPQAPLSGLGRSSPQAAVALDG
ncbi:hypothetical protein AMC82_CH00580 [Rhizobium phaseoli]|nr:hypothetical protein AMC82_CH00580 [Rhizobium phaseoli]